MIWKVPTRFCQMLADTLSADKAFDGDTRVIEPLLRQEKARHSPGVIERFNASTTRKCTRRGTQENFY